MNTPVIESGCVVPLLDTKYVRVFDLQYAPGRHYYDATRRPPDQLAAIKTEEEFRSMCPDAVTCVVVLRLRGQEPRLLLFYEYRYPTGRFLLSPVAGLIDPEDRESGHPLLSAAAREIFEETGVRIGAGDKLFEVNPLLFSSPGLTDECVGLACAVVDMEDLSCLTQSGAEGSECFNGFELVGREQALEILRHGRDRFGNYYSAHTWCVLMYFVSGLWQTGGECGQAAF